MTTTPSPAAADAKPGQYVVVARRYRPQTFEELVGQERVAKALTGAIRANRVGHAYLFTGARGVGKTSAARILAKALDCIHGPTPTPCNECDICQSISTGDDVDVLEIDGASNRGIDEIRELRQKVNVRPSRARYKIYIIDEVHMLTREAFNALLKTLEEPPEHVKFIFCTTEAEKIPITILSRCQRFDFAGIQTLSIAERLKQIAAAENVEAESGALEILARRAAGSMRDSQSLLEQLLSFGGQQITVADVHRLLGTAADGRIGPLVEHLLGRDAAAALADLGSALDEGVDVGQLLEQLLGYFRDLMVTAVGCPADALLYVTPSQREQVKAAAQQFSLDAILAVMQVLDQALARLRYSTHSRTLAELALVRITSLADLESLSALIEQLGSGTSSSAGSNSPPQRLAAPRSEAVPIAEAKKKDEPLAASFSAAAVTPAPVPVASSDAVLAADQLTDVWRQALEMLSELTSTQIGMAERVAIGAPNRLVVAFREKYNSCKAFCERPDQVARLERALFEVTRIPVRVEFATIADPVEVRPVSDDRPRPSRGERLQEKAQHPMVRKAVELFDARPIRVESPET